MEKIIIFYAKYGYGHIKAAKALEEASNNKNVDIHVIDCIEYVNKFINKISTKAYDKGTKNVPKLWKFCYEKSECGTMSKFVTKLTEVMSSKLLKLISEINPNLIISVHPFSSQMCAILKKNGKINCKLATLITDFHIHNQWIALPEYIDYFFVASNFVKNDMERLGIPKEKIHITGIPISKNFNQKFDKTKIFEYYNLDSNKFTILFFGNGEFGKSKENPYDILKTIINLSENIQVIAISGDNYKMSSKFENIVNETNSRNRVKILNYTNDIASLMHISDIIITKPGGLTVSESLASSLPIIIMNPIPGQEEENADFLIKSGCAIYIKNSKDVISLYEDFSKNPQKLAEMKESSIKIAKPNSANKIWKILGY